MAITRKSTKSKRNNPKTNKKEEKPFYLDDERAVEDDVKMIYDLQNQGFSDFEITYRLKADPILGRYFKSMSEKVMKALFRKARNLRKEASILSNEEQLENEILTMIYNYKKAYRLAMTGVQMSGQPFPLYKPNPEAASRILNDFTNFCKELGLDLKRFVSPELKQDETTLDHGISQIVTNVITKRDDS